MTNKYRTIILTIGVILVSCKINKPAEEPFVLNDTQNLEGIPYHIEVITGPAYHHPSFVIWTETLQGDYMQTLFVTEAYAKGVYPYGALSDTTWANASGEQYRPAALPYWTHKKGLIGGEALVPNIHHPFVDGFSGATPLSSFMVNGKVKESSSRFKVLLEVNQTGDWNKDWIPSKFRGDRHYKTSAQPSLVYAVELDPDLKEKVYTLNPIGHGNPSGEDGQLFTDLSSLTTAKQIIHSITIRLNP